MDYKIVSTAYAPLRPPYQIIKYDQDVAMQIGTLIVTVQKDTEDYQIETHSHPVVSYENKHIEGLTEEQLAGHQILEGAVWNNVEVKDVTTVCLIGATLSWQKFIEVLEYETFLNKFRSAPDVMIYWKLKKLGVTILPPDVRKCTVHLSLAIQPEEAGLSLQSNRTMPLYLNVPVAENEKDQSHIIYNRKKKTWRSDVWKENEHIWSELTTQLFSYQHVLRDLLFDEEDGQFTVTYTTDVERFQPIVENMNVTFSKMAFSV